MIVEIERHSGFCFGVVSAIQRAEKELQNNKGLYCLGDIVHNSAEVERLAKCGLFVISHDEFSKLSNCKVLIRAHGEPPETYAIAKKQNITLVDATCPIVLKLQQHIREGYQDMQKIGGQILIYGKPGHAEVVGLEGQTEHCAIVIDDHSDFQNIDFSKPIRLYSQTTKSKERYEKLQKNIREKFFENADFIAFDTICGQVANRAKELYDFCKKHQLVLFVSGKNSSNGKYLFDLCKQTNPHTHFISDVSELKSEWFETVNSVGICGATSTPMWLMEDVKKQIYLGKIV
ncbi:MAG: 4-hydroxy-3-methylbut-2-enyl diphosphate reductase [Bacteroidales bacterium]|jgi:4-hydroxy-3-methylbut-2-enyl diphosphate reductase|nr:4-hydroxy-3-methylbut-2-enyl diphosphate reductase [Bacteroidales bacterium]